MSLHEHNELSVTNGLVGKMTAGDSIALVCDAGTPLINDPGFNLLRKVRDAELPIVPVPGPCSLIAALSVSGLPTDRFCFEGFPPRTGPARREFFRSLVDLPRTVIFFESCHRILACMNDLAAVFPGGRRLVIARELTKVHETIIDTSVSGVGCLVAEMPYMQKGEFVVLLQGASAAKKKQVLRPEQVRALEIMLTECSVKTATAVISRITGLSRKVIYQAALNIAQGRST